MNAKAKLSAATAALVFAPFVTNPVFAAPHFEVKITNITKAQTFTPILLLGLMFGLLAIVNYGTYFTHHFECRATLSFLGLPVFQWYPSEEACRNSSRVIMAVIDGFFAFLVVGSVWFKYRASRG